MGGRRRLCPVFLSLVLEAAYSFSPSAPLGAAGCWGPIRDSPIAGARAGPQGRSSVCLADGRWLLSSTSYPLLCFAEFSCPGWVGDEGSLSRGSQAVLWPSEFRDLGLVAKIMAGEVAAVVSCSSLTAPVRFPLFGARLALTCLCRPRWLRLRLCGSCSLPSLINGRKDAFQKKLWLSRLTSRVR